MSQNRFADKEIRNNKWSKCNFPMDDDVRNFIMSPLVDDTENEDFVDKNYREIRSCPSCKFSSCELYIDFPRIFCTKDEIDTDSLLDYIEFLHANEVSMSGFCDEYEKKE